MSRRFALLAVFVFVLGAISGPAVSATIYNIDVSAGSMSAKGTITTDSTLGTLSTANILDWHIYLATSTESFTLNGASNSVAAIAGTGVSAQASGLYFDFSRVDGGFLVLEAMPLGGGLNYLCFDGHHCGLWRLSIECIRLSDGFRRAVRLRCRRSTDSGRDHAHSTRVAFVCFGARWPEFLRLAAQALSVRRVTPQRVSRSDGWMLMAGLFFGYLALTCSILHWLGFLSGRHRMNLDPCRIRPPAT